MQRYSNNSMEELAAQLKGGLLRLRKGYVEAAESLLDVIDDEAEYPLEFVLYRITGFRPARGAQQSPTLAGKKLRADLMKLILDISGSFVFKVGEADGISDVPQLAKRFGISIKTVQRWRHAGLPARRMVFPDGSRRLCFRESAVGSFVRKNPTRIARAARFGRLGKREKDEIIRRARRMAAFTHCSLADVAKRLARRTGRGAETIRRAIRTHDAANPRKAVFPNMGAPLKEQQREEIYRSFLRGTSVTLLARRFGRARDSIYRIIYETRAGQLIRRPIEYVHNPMFDLPDADELILGRSRTPEVALPAADDQSALPEPQTTEGEDAAGRSVVSTSAQRPKAELPPYLKALYEAPLLSSEQEMELFRRMNYLKCKADKLRRQVKIHHVLTSRLTQIESLLMQANAIKNQIVRANLRLVVSIAKKHVNNVQSLFELVSDGNVTLMRTVERFDYSRGFRFSTYASWSIMRSFARTVPKERYQMDHFTTGNEEILDIASGLQTYNPDELNLPELRESIEAVLTQLSPRERAILIEHYGLDAGREPQTLDQISQGLGVSKERVRQIEAQAIKKLRRIMNPERSGLTA
jgi:RNA polymerase sigma factor (sigma-70 family)